VANVAAISHADQFDPNPGNNTATATVTPVPVPPAVADLALSKTVDQNSVMFGFDATFALVVRNQGPDAATGVVVADPLPAGLVFVSSSPSQGTFDPNSGLWSVGTLPDGAAATLVVVERVASFGPIVNTARAAADQSDPDLSNNGASAVVVGANPASIISKRDFLASKLGNLPQPNALGDPTQADLAFIDGVYRALLGRHADPTGEANWLAALMAGAPRSAVARGVFDSAEHRGLEVDRFYLELLHRPADASGRATWVNALLAGMSEADVQASLLSSPEYQAEHASDSAFVSGLYQDVLGRAADPAGLASKLALLQGGVSRGQVIAAVLSSPEALGRIVDGDYAAFLGRAADAAGRAAFLGQLLAGGPGQAESVGVQVLASQEFFLDSAGL
jgi:uncharacterized repeat protein (TIGR01451 family)